MMLDAIEKNGLESKITDTTARLKALHSSFGSSISPENAAYAAESNAYDSATADILGLANAEQLALNKVSAFQTIKGMYNGTDIYGNKVLGLKEISEWKINPDFKHQNIKQHAGFSAEVLGTAKENLRAKADGTGTISYRVDDLPDSIRKQFGDRFANKNDQYVDKIRMKADGTYETVQTKFVGNNSGECFNKLKSKRYDKYFEDGRVDKIEVPKDYYDDIKTKQIPQEKAKLQKQIDHLKAKGETEKAAKVESKLDRINKVDEKLEKSLVTSKEATFATKHPKLYSANRSGLQGAKGAAELTFIISSAENIHKYAKGDISGLKAVETVFKDTAIGGGTGYCLNFISGLTGSNVPAAAITMGISSYSDIKDFTNGDISGSELAYNLGENVFRIAGGIVGATAGSPLGIFGMAGGGIAGSEAAAQLYKVGIDYVSDHFEIITEKASDFKDMAIDFKDTAGDKLGDLKDAAGDKLGDLKDTAAEKLGDLKNGAADKIGSAKSGAVKLLKKI